MANFDVAFEWLMTSEDPKGTFEMTPDAPPGAYAIAGINSHSFPTAFRRISIQPSSARRAEVYNFYLNYFWNPGQFNKLRGDDLAKRVFDAAVNMGSVTAVKILQRALEITDDGQWGSETVSTANGREQDGLRIAFRAWRDREYDAIIKGRPEYEKYRNGWMERAQR